MHIITESSSWQSNVTVCDDADLQEYTDAWFTPFNQLTSRFNYVKSNWYTSAADNSGGVTFQGPGFPGIAETVNIGTASSTVKCDIAAADLTEGDTIYVTYNGLLGPVAGGFVRVSLYDNTAASAVGYWLHSNEVAYVPAGVMVTHSVTAGNAANGMSIRLYNWPTASNNCLVPNPWRFVVLRARNIT